jgi:PAS domain S-box-containing protein
MKGRTRLMVKKTGRKRKETDKLRRRAEELLARDPKVIQEMPPEDVRELVQELNVHQIELELQNEELREAQLELEAARNKFVDLYDFAPVGYFTLDEKGLVLEVNLTGASLLGVPRHNLINRVFSRFVAPDFEGKFYAHLRRALQGETKQMCELKCKKKDGALFYAQLETMAVNDVEGNRRHLRTAITDITERKQAEENLKKTMAELTRSNTELEEFAYIVSHDLREPLRMVSSFMELLRRRYKDKLDADGNEFISLAADGAKRMNMLIKDLVAYSRVGFGGEKFKPTDCGDILSQTLENLKVTIKANDAVVTHNSLPMITAAASQIIELFQNLIGNAIKFRAKEPPHIHVSAKEGEKEWIFSVRDNGIGIDPQYKERIFAVFRRLHGREEYSGSGIGLSICRKIVERHGGRIWVASEPGRGSTFYFTIPTMAGQ